MGLFDVPDKFENRHIGPTGQETTEMLEKIGVNSVEQLIEETIPADIRLKKEIALDEPMPEHEFLEYIREIASKNQIAKSYIGMGYYPTILPPVIQRNILENPGWYTQYTPYQAEISQGRLEALLNYQTMISDLTALPVANASLLDEGTAAAEAMLMLFASSKSNKKNFTKFFVDKYVFPQTLKVMETRANPHGIRIVTGDYDSIDFSEGYFGILLQYPNSNGEIIYYKKIIDSAKQNGVYVVMAADLLSLSILTPPGEMGADAAVGSSQRFGVPMGYGGPHAAYFAVKDEFKRIVPGRIIGMSIDAEGNNALRMALQTREQHIRREKATSNICTAQVLLAIMAGMYAVYHGPQGIKKIGERIHALTNLLDRGLKEIGINQLNKTYFDTLKIQVEKDLLPKIKKEAESKLINFRYDENAIGISLHEAVKVSDIVEILELLSTCTKKKFDHQKFNLLCNTKKSIIPVELKRESSFLQHQVFNSYQSETEMLRYLKRLENKDLSLTASMIPLGSCTMKLNSASEMLSITLPGLTNIHPFAPKEQTEGYDIIVNELGKSLLEITGFSGISFQPNSGAQGEYAGLMVIREFHISRNEQNRTVVLIPCSAHGTNPASAVMAGMKVVVVNCDAKGNIDINDLKLKAEQNKENLAALMVTYPSTHGVFEENIVEICNIIHNNGGQVYMDGANMNAQVGFTSPGFIGADVCHLNLHKTFAIPHGGGGPGMGPICVAEHLKQFLPTHPIQSDNNEKGIGPVAASHYGSANILVISLGYIKMLGAEGLKNSSLYAILNANYIMAKLQPYYKVLYTGERGRVAHELIFDMREFKHTINLEVEDIAKRLMDYGFHAPTVSFPVAGTLMVEPTESESKFELDRFCNAMISIREEIKEIEDGKADKTNNVLKNSPHTQKMVISDEWKFPYSREKAVFPDEWVKNHKFWVSVARVNNAYGDRNLVCSCNPVSDYK